MLTDNDKKLELVQWIIELNDSKMILDLMQIKKNLATNNRFSLTELEKSELQKGIDSLVAGNTVSHETVLKKIDGWR